MPAFTNISYEVRGANVYLTINRPEALNALNQSTLAEIQLGLNSARDDARVRGVILTGAGNRAFVAGADITELAAISAIEAAEFTQRGQSVLNLVENLGKPVIAAVNGFALGGGCEIAMACTFRIATENARFGQPEVKLGVTPGFGGTQRLPRLIGKGRAMQMILTAEPIDAREALRIGLINELVTPDRLIARAEEILLLINANAPLAVRYSMEAVNRGLDVGQGEGLVIERALFSVCAASKDKHEGTSAFLEKRAPRFTGS